MSKYVWLKVNDYVNNMPIFSRICWNLKIIIHVKQTFGCGVYVGLFRFNFKNPLTWLLILLIYIICLLVNLWDAITLSIKYTKGIFDEGVKIEIDKK